MAFLRDIEKLIRMTIPVNDRRADQRRAEGLPAKRASTQLPGTAKQHWHRDGPARRRARRNRPSANPSDIDSVAFLHHNSPPGPNRAPRAQRWAGPSKGT